MVAVMTSRSSDSCPQSWLEKNAEGSIVAVALLPRESHHSLPCTFAPQGTRDITVTFTSMNGRPFSPTETPAAAPTSTINSVCTNSPPTISNGIIIGSTIGGLGALETGIGALVYFLLRYHLFCHRLISRRASSTSSLNAVRLSCSSSLSGTAVVPFPPDSHPTSSPQKNLSISHVESPHVLVRNGENLIESGLSLFARMEEHGNRLPTMRDRNTDDQPPPAYDSDTQLYSESPADTTEVRDMV